MTRTNMAMKLIYFHGFGSSAASGTIRTLREKLPDFEVIAPDIPVDPAEALPFLRELCEKEQPNVVVGTSMGGMYAQQMFGFNRICVNPAFFMSKSSKVLKVGTFEALIFTTSPVRGLRPSRAARSFTPKVPKPIS